MYTLSLSICKYIIKKFYHYLMVSFVRQRNNLMVKKNTDHYLSIYAYFLYLQNGYYIKNWLFTKKITGIFVIEGKKQVSIAMTMSALS